MLDYEHLLRLDLWPDHYAALYLADVEPLSGAWHACMVGPIEGATDAPEFADLCQRVRQLRHLIDVAIRAGRLKTVLASSPEGEVWYLVPTELVRWAIEKKLHVPAPFRSLVADSSRGWPWGAYSTPLLDLMARAVKQFWVDASQPPKSVEVENWLVREGKCSRRTATAIAQIIRREGIKPGPRPRKR